MLVSISIATAIALALQHKEYNSFANLLDELANDVFEGEMYYKSELLEKVLKTAPIEATLFYRSKTVYKNEIETYFE